MNYYQEFKELYYKELEHSDRINSKIPLIISFLTVLASAEIFFLKELVKNTAFDKWYYIVFLIMCTISVIMYIYSIIYFRKTYYVCEYHYIPIKDVNEYFNTVFKSNKETKEDKLNSWNENMMKRLYTNFAIWNQEQNYKKQVNHQIMINWIIRTFILVAILFVIWVICWSNLVTETIVNS